jgi:Zn ribbon nucleic-acid-binding protein
VTFRRGLDFAIDLVTSGLWALAAFFAGARLISPNAGMVLALAVFVTAMTYVLTSRAQEHRAHAIAAGACPRCNEALTIEHEHRRWDTSNSQWLAPLTTWQCVQCGFQQEASLGCEACPGAA